MNNSLYLVLFMLSAKSTDFLKTRNSMGLLSGIEHRSELVQLFPPKTTTHYSSQMQRAVERVDTTLLSHNHTGWLVITSYAN